MKKFINAILLLSSINNLTAQNFPELRTVNSPTEYITERVGLLQLQNNGLNRDAVVLILKALEKAGKEKNHTEFVFFLNSLPNEINASLYETDDIPALYAPLKKMIPTLTSPSLDFALMHLLEYSYPAEKQATYRDFMQLEALTYEVAEEQRINETNAIYTQIYSHKNALLAFPIVEILPEMDSTTVFEEPSAYEYFARRTNYFELTNQNAQQEKLPFLIAKSWFNTMEKGVIIDFKTKSSTIGDGTYKSILLHLIEMEKYHFAQKRFEAAARYAILRLTFIFNADDYDENVSQPENLSSIEQERMAITAAYLEHLKFYGVTNAGNLFVYHLANDLFNASKTYDYKSNTSVGSDATKAIEIINKTLTKFPIGYKNKTLESLRAAILKEKIQFQTMNAVAIAQPILIKVDYTNLTKAYLKIVKLNKTTIGKRLSDYVPSDYSIVYERELNLENDDRHLKHTKEFVIDGIKNPGDYVIYIVNSNENWIEKLIKATTNEPDAKFVFSRTDLNIHNILINTSNSPKGTDLYITDIHTGKPVKGAKAAIYGMNQKEMSNPLKFNHTSDKNGWISLPSTYDYRSNLVVAFNGDTISHGIYSNTYVLSPNGIDYNITTDRSLYRPGQIVKFKVIAYQHTNGKYAVAEGINIELILTNYEAGDIATIKGITNSFGSFSGEIQLPQNALTGSYDFRINENTYQNIQIEEYKRPTFEITLDEMKEGYALGQEVTLKGKVMALSGVPVQNANVKVQIDYQPYYWYRYANNGENEDENYSFTVKTDNEGSFTVKFTSKVDKNSTGKGFNITATATSQTGETHESSSFIHLGKDLYQASISSDSQFIGDHKVLVTPSVTNQQGVNQEKGKGILSLYAIAKIEGVTFPRPWVAAEYSEFSTAQLSKMFPNYAITPAAFIEPVAFAQINVNSNVEVDLSSYCKKGGDYRVEFVSDNLDFPFEKVSTSFQVIKKKTHLNSPLWIAPSTTNAEPGESIELYLGSAFKTIKSMVEIHAGDNLISRQFVTIKASKKLKLKITEAMRGNVDIRVIAVKNGQSYQQQSTIYVPYSNKVLNIEFRTLRKTISPGKVEEISIHINDFKKVTALETEVLASMYDASLDQINGGNYWHFSPYENNYSNRYWGQFNYFNNTHVSGYDYDYYSESLFQLNPTTGYADYALEEMDYRGDGVAINPRNPFTYSWSETGSSGKGNGFSSGNGSGFSSVQSKGSVTNSLTVLDVSGNTTTPKPQDGPPPRIRSNFNETAFFTPNLVTDAAGNATITYTVPDALTRWRLQVLAHDKQLRIGTVSQLLETRKEVMAQAYTPRFFRSGDTMIIRATVNNLLPEAISPKVTFALIDPYTDKEVSAAFQIMEAATQLIASKASGEYQWKVIVPENYSVVKYRLIANNGVHSDGEEKLIPILGNREYVQETKSITLAAKGTNVFQLEKLANNTSTTLKTERLSLEFTSSPLWSVILSMPYLMEFPHECAEQTFARLFANTISARIVATNPEIQNLFTLWKTTTPEIFMSELNKNPELKNMLLNETPWINEAKSENDQRLRIATLFDKNRLAKEQKDAIDKLVNMQNNDGGLPWFNGGPSNPYISLHVVSGIHDLNTDDERLLYLKTKILNYLDTYFEHEYTTFITNYKDKKPGLTETHILWLLTRSKNAAKESDASRHYAKLLQTEWIRYSINVQAIAGSYFQVSNQTVLSKKVIASMQNRASKKGISMYWAEAKNGYLWHQSAIETQARTIQFFTAMGANAQDIRAMKNHLLLNKLANAWETTKETTMACEALLLDGTRITNNDFPNIIVGNQDINAESLMQKNGGYFKKTWNGEEVKPEMANVRIESKTDQLQYGALHWAYYEDMSKITKASNGISISRNYFAKNDKDQLVKVELNNLKVGQKLTVVLSFKVDQEMDYVHLKDQRAAGVEPTNQISGYFYQAGISGYQAVKDASINFFFDHLTKGMHAVSYEVFITSEGQLSMGTASLECMYAPEFKGHSDGTKIKVSK